jgi:uncharacterized protein
MAAVEHDQNNSRFVWRVPEAGDGGEVAFLSYVLLTASTPPVMDLTHTFTPVSMRGRGVAGKLVAAAFAYARENDMKIIPSCSYIPAWVARHPAEADLVRGP